MWTGFIIVLALVGMSTALVRSLTPRMEGMGPTGSMPMPENDLDDMQRMDIGGMDHSGMNMNNQESTSP